MKKVILVLSLLSTLGFSEIVEVQIPETISFTQLPVVTVSRTFQVSGCSDYEVELSVLKSDYADLYVVGKSLKVPEAVGFPITCKAIVDYTEKASFAVHGKPGSIYLELPQHDAFNFDIKVEVKTFPVY